MVVSVVDRCIVWIILFYKDKRQIWWNHFHHEDDEEVCACVLGFTKTMPARRWKLQRSQGGSREQVGPQAQRCSPRCDGRGLRTSRHLDAVEGRLHLVDVLFVVLMLVNVILEADEQLVCQCASGRGRSAAALVETQVAVFGPITHACKMGGCIL